jgi:hypothetical protein
MQLLEHDQATLDQILDMIDGVPVGTEVRGKLQTGL